MGLPIKNHIALSIAVIALASVGRVHCIDCSEIVTFVAEENVCRTSGSLLNCSISTTTTITIPPYGQSACLLIKNQAGKPIGTMELRFDEIRMICKPIVHHYTRDYQMKHYDYNALKRKNKRIVVFRKKFSCLRPEKT